MKRWIKYSMIAMICTVLLELFVFNYQAVKHEKDCATFQLSGEDAAVAGKTEETLVLLSEDEQKSILMNRANDKIMAEVNHTPYLQEKDDTLVEDGTKMYRKKISTTYTITLPKEAYMAKLAIAHPNLEKQAAYELTVYRKGQSVWHGIDGIAEERIEASVMNVNTTGDCIIYRMLTEQEPDTAQMQLSILNYFQWSPLRMLFILITCILLFAFIDNKDIFVHRPERVFAILSMTLGTLLILLIGTNQIGYDEHVHAARAHAVSFGSTIQTTETAMRMKANDLPIFHNIEERKLIESYEDKNNDYSWADITTQSRFVSYEDRSYLPIGIFLRIGRLLGLPFAWCIMLGKMGNLLCYTAVSYFAIRLAKTGKGLIAVLALIPNQLLAATTITYDGIVNSFLLLAIVLTTNLFLEKDNQMTWGQVLLVLGAYIAGSTAKPIYMVMALSLLFLSRRKFVNRQQEYLFKLSVIGLVALLLYTIFFPPVSTSSNYELMGNLAYAGDKRNQGTGVLGQLQYIFSNPWAYTKLLLDTMFTDLWKYLTGQQPFFNLGYLGGLSGVWTILAVCLFGMAALIRPITENRPVLPLSYKLMNAGMIFGVTAIIWTSMYVSFTPIGNPAIEGVQGRYFIPLFLPAMYCFFNRKLTCTLRSDIYYKILFGAITVLNLWSIYALALKPFNF
ncbi:MAG: DUF2142 domain-containing protein [Lachnospiraceae bacterium]